MVEQITAWPRESEHRPFDAAAFNRLMSWLDGYIAGPFRLVQVSGSFALIWDPTTDLFTFGASIVFGATITLDNTIWLDGFAADGVTPIHLIRVTSGDLIQLGASSQRMTIGAALTNATYLNGRNAANTGEINLIRVNSSDIIELGETGTRLTVLSPLTNNTAINGRNAANSGNISLIGLTSGDLVLIGQTGQRMTLASSLTNATYLNGRNAANSGDVNLIRLNGSDVVEVGQTGSQTNLLGRAVVASNDPPLQDGELTAGSQRKAGARVTGSSGAMGNNYNVASVTRNGAGDYTVAWDRDFSSDTYEVYVTVEDNAAWLMCKCNSKTASSADIHIATTAGVLTDPDFFSVAAFGTLS
jgi:hypothetical protein